FMNNSTNRPFKYEPGDKEYVHDLFKNQVGICVDLIAVRSGDRKITYRDLDVRSQQLANRILKQSPRSSIVGISTTRSVEMIVGVLAILKAGKAYLPLDPSYPQDRLDQIVKDSGIDCCLAGENETHFFESFGISVINPDKQYSDNAASDYKQSSLAYILYTSGST